MAGVTVGHVTNTEAHTGCTVVLVPDGAVAAVDVRGGAPGTRETDILAPYSSVGKVHGVLMTGGSAFGLAAADGVVSYLEERGYGHRTPYASVPLVPAAVIYDLGVGHPHVRPRPEDGYRAAAAAGVEIEEGSVGVGTGATIGKILGEDGWMKGGFGVAAVDLPGGVTVMALTVVNAFGDVLAEDGTVLGGARAPGTAVEAGEGARATTGLQFLDSARYLRSLQDHPRFNDRIEHTTLSVVVTDARLDSTQCGQIARMTHDGFARAISPVHTPVDGDAVFVLSVGGRESNVFQVGAAAADTAAAAIRRAVILARGLPGVPALAEL
ncbi:MAG: P1 family peptidase [Thermoleophilia bacterium]